MTPRLSALAPTALLTALVLAAAPALAQNVAFDETNDALFAPLVLPTPNQYRAADGRPGPAYWQNENDYRIEAALDTTTHTVTGTVRLTYTNNSPQALDYLWMHLEQNLFAPASRGALRTPPDSRWRGSFPEGGYQIGTVTAGGQPVTPVVTDTRMRIDLPAPLRDNGGTVEVVVPYSFVVPEYGADRMGRLETAAGTVYEFAQWYPRVAVYDDVHGWNPLPYLGQGEFYLGYGDFEYDVTVPSSMTVVGTGELLNEGEVYTDVQRERLARVRQSPDRVYIVEPDEVGRARPAGGMTTWRYRAENVRDVAWAASDAFILDGANAAVELEDGTTNDVLILSAYPSEGVGTPDNPGWEEATRFGRASILANSRWYPYPYPVAISVAGVVGGMEYPMLHFSGVDARFMSLFGVIDHELGHNWFPMIVGSDERRYAWMDEGFNSYLNTFANREFYDANPDPTIAGYGQADSARVIRLTEGPAAADFARQPYAVDQPIMTYPDRIRRPALGWLAYRKPAKGLLLLRNTVVGPERFDEAFEEYIQRWAYKHPQPADFFRTIEDVTGEDLSWFWRGWFYETGLFDQALVALDVVDGRAVATVENRGAQVLPTTVEFRFADGTTEVVTVPAEAYFGTDTTAARVELDGRTVVSARIDPTGDLPDDDPTDNVRTL
ncbi:M1 family metallopeptidase [Rubrivirga litoralis]|uniref:M1 family metallopeptidase n=1 Tax=Rubrivirga litoralis TaxID=3075598 RepID=A0ABU3BPD5_9BACT|nr:M1 family metallopeptidase [Rubrivirga sp. F394]MDT0631149.1 M1 family metallopeptidase [Rubrivirga sp. F394]